MTTSTLQYIKDGLVAYCELRKTKFSFRDLPVAKNETEVFRAKAKFSVGDETFVIFEMHDDEFCVRENTVKGSAIIEYVGVKGIYSQLLEHLTGKSMFINKCANSSERYLMFDNLESIEGIRFRFGDFVDITRLPQFTHLFQKDRNVDDIDNDIFLFMSTYFHPSSGNWNNIQFNTVEFKYDVSEKYSNSYTQITVRLEFNW